MGKDTLIDLSGMEAPEEVVRPSAGGNGVVDMVPPQGGKISLE